MKSSRIGLVVSSFAILGSLITGAGPASAEPNLGTGLIRFDGTWATVKTLTDGSTVLTLNKEATGQWMGEIGRSLVPVVRDIDDRRLVSAWNQVGHKSGFGVDATMTWNSLADFARVDLSDPSMTPRGHLRFVVDPDTELPARMENVSVNIARSDAIQTRSFPVNVNYALTATASASTSLQFAYVASVSLINSGMRCYEYTLSQQVPNSTLPANIACGSVAFTSSTSTMGLPTPSQTGHVFFSSTLSVSGSPFVFSGVIATWSVNGS